MYHYFHVYQMYIQEKSSYKSLRLSSFDRKGGIRYKNLIPMSGRIGYPANVSNSHR